MISALFVPFIYTIANGSIYYLEPASPNGIQLYTRTSGIGFVSYSHVYIKYSTFNAKDTGIVFSEDDGPGLCNETSNYIVNWIDDHHVEIAFKGNSYTDYRIEEIEY